MRVRLGKRVLAVACVRERYRAPLSPPHPPRRRGSSAGGLVRACSFKPVPHARLSLDPRFRGECGPRGPLSDAGSLSHGRARPAGCCRSSPDQTRERGAWCSAVGRTCSSLRWRMRVSTRPGWPFVPVRTHEEFDGHPGHVSPGALAPCPFTRFSVVRANPIVPGPSGFMSPEAVLPKFASPRRALPADGLLSRCLGEASPTRPEASEATPANAPDIQSFGRLGPPSCQVRGQYTPASGPIESAGLYPTLWRARALDSRGKIFGCPTNLMHLHPPVWRHSALVIPAERSESRDPGRQALACVALGPGFRRDERSERRGNLRMVPAWWEPGFSGCALLTRE